MMRVHSSRRFMCPCEQGRPGKASWLVMLLVGLFGFLPVLSLAATASLDKVTYTSLPGNKVQVKLQLSAPLQGEPLSFTIDNPARIALDLPDTHLNLPGRNQSINLGAAHSLNAVEAGNRTRVVLNLVRLVPYDLKLDGNELLITLNSNKVSSTPGTPEEVVPVTAGRVMPAPADSLRGSGQQLRNIDFHRGSQGEGRVVVTLPSNATMVSSREESGKIILDFPGVKLPERLNQRLDVMDFATPVKEIDTVRTPNGVQMVVTPFGAYEHLAYQSDNVYTLEVRPLAKHEEEARKKEVFTGERLSLNFQNIEVRAVLQLLADFTGMNLVASDTVNGSVTLRLKNVPWDQALNIILKARGLGMRQNGNVMMVAPQEEIAAREKLELESQKQISELAPLHTEYVQVNYAKAADLAALIKADKNNLLSERGNISLDERTNTLLIQETAEKIAEMRKLITKLDVAVRQVLIESRIVIANQDFSKDLGVKFGFSRSATDDSGFGYTLGGKRPGDVKFGSGTTSIATGFTDASTKNENYIVSLPTIQTPAAALGLAVGKIGSYLLQLELSALQAEGRGEIISSPRVITADQKEAVIEQGEEIPFQRATSSGATSVEFKKAVLSLKVTPRITPDDRIIMDLAVNKDSRGAVTPAGFAIDTQNVATQVLVDNGETVVLGGVYEQNNRSQINRVPFFSDLPYINRLFRQQADTRNKKELLIFVTPRIMKEGLDIGANP